MIKHVKLNPSLQLMGEATVNQPVTAELTLLNPLPEPLQDCSFTIEGVGLTDGKPITVKWVNWTQSVMSRFLACLCTPGIFCLMVLLVSLISRYSLCTVLSSRWHLLSNLLFSETIKLNFYFCSKNYPTYNSKYKMLLFDFCWYNHEHNHGENILKTIQSMPVPSPLKLFFVFLSCMQNDRAGHEAEILLSWQIMFTVACDFFAGLELWVPNRKPKPVLSSVPAVLAPPCCWWTLTVTNWGTSRASSMLL